MEDSAVRGRVVDYEVRCATGNESEFRIVIA